MSSSSNRLQTRAHKVRVAIVLCLAVLLGLSGCGSYPAIKSREGRQLIKRLYVVCNSKSAQKLTSFEEDLAKLSSAGTLNSTEKRAFDSIVEMARKGQWEAAEKAALKLADDQIGHELPAENTP